MQERARRYVQRRPTWLGRMPRDGAAFVDSPVRTGGVPEKQAAPRGRRRRGHFGEQLEAVRAAVGYTPDDDASVQASKELIAPHVDEIVAAVYRQMLAQPETAMHFAGSNGVIDPQRVAMRRAAFSAWLRSVVGDPMDASTGEYLATIGHAQVRPRDAAEHRVKARHLVRTVSQVQTMFIAILASTIDEPDRLGRCAAAWCKRLIIHLDLLLAVYGATESSAHWY
jgi:hypothetical protein